MFDNFWEFHFHFLLIASKKTWTPCTRDVINTWSGVATSLVDKTDMFNYCLLVLSKVPKWWQSLCLSHNKVLHLKLSSSIFFPKRRDLRKTVNRQNSSRGRKLKAGFVPSSSANLFGSVFQILRLLWFTRLSIKNLLTIKIYHCSWQDIEIVTTDPSLPRSEPRKGAVKFRLMINPFKLRKKS